MRTENTKTGLEKVFRGEALGLVADVILILSTIAVGIVGLGAAAADTLTETAEASFGIAFLAAGILVIVGMILALVSFFKQLKGLKLVGNDNGTFKTAFWFVIFSLVLTFVANLLGEKLPLFASVAGGFAALVDLGVAYYVVKGCTELFAGTELEKQGKDLIKWLFALGIVRGMCSGMTGMEGGMVLLFGFAEIVLTVIFYIFYLTYLSRAKAAA